MKINQAKLKIDKCYFKYKSLKMLDRGHKQKNNVNVIGYYSYMLDKYLQYLKNKLHRMTMI